MDHQKAVLGLATAEVKDEGITAVVKQGQVRGLVAGKEAANPSFIFYKISYGGK